MEKCSGYRTVVGRHDRTVTGVPADRCGDQDRRRHQGAGLLQPEAGGNPPDTLQAVQIPLHASGYSSR